MSALDRAGEAFERTFCIAQRHHLALAFADVNTCHGGNAEVVACQ